MQASIPTPESIDTRLSGNAPSVFSTALTRALTLGLILSAAFVAFFPFFAKSSWMIYQEDDFFYYLKIADNLARGHGSTWNGLVPTNGYHPLWLALLAAQSRIFGSPFAAQIFLSLTIFIATVSTYLLCRRLLQLQCDNAPLTSALAVYVALYSMHLFNTGMEVILTIPLVFAVAVAFQSSAPWHTSSWRNFGFGLLVSAVCLSRLDTTIFIALLFAATLLHPTLRARLNARQLLFVLLGLLPLMLYFLSNQLAFHTWIPISGMAKQLKVTHLPSAPAWNSLFSKSPRHLLNLLPIAFAIGLLPAIYRKLTATQQALFPVLLLFPFVYIFLLSCLSDWQIWDWYFYSLRPALCVALAILLLWQPSSRLLNRTAVTALIALVAFAQLVTNHRSPASAGGADMYSMATEIRSFAATHPGVYAMGDRAGMLAYLMPNPIVQTEGLVMDRPFLRLIEHRTPLLQALAPYHVRYYVAATKTPYTGCFHASEPPQAGPASPHMTDDICSAPVAIWNHDFGQTLIFDLNDLPPNKTAAEAPPNERPTNVRMEHANFAQAGAAMSDLQTQSTQHATGSFDVKIVPQPADQAAGAPAVSRMLLDKHFHGDLEATSKGTMLTAGSPAKGSSGAYVALEIVTGSLNARTGTFVLQHTGIMTLGTPTLTIAVVPGSGTGQFTGLSGEMAINLADGKHTYDLEYTLPKTP